MEYKIKVNLRVDDILFLVLVYIGLGIVFAFLSALFLFIPMASPVLITVYVLVISLITIKRVLEMIRIIQVENLNDVTKIKKNVPEEAKQKNTNAPKQNIIKSTVEKNITDFEKYEREFFDWLIVNYDCATLNSSRYLILEKKEVIKMCINEKRKNDVFLHAKPVDCDICME